MLQHYPDDEVIFEHYVDRADPERGFGRSDDVPATFLILKGYTSRPQAREYLLKLLNPAPETPFARSPTLLTDHVPWEEIATTFADDAEVVAAIRALARKHVASPIGERDLYFCSAVVSED